MAVKIGISFCLLGAKVRFDGGHERDAYITEILGPHVKFVPICPELEVGMSVPRESVRLAGDPGTPCMVGIESGEDWTARMNRYADARVRRPDLVDLAGFILKKRSPSCGMARVKVHLDNGTVQKKGVGLFARALQKQHPCLPIEEEGRLSDASVRENFVVRLFAYNRLRQLLDHRFRRGEVVKFHTAHKYLLLAHSPKHYRQLGRLVAAVKQVPVDEFRECYRQGFMETLRFKATVKKNVNVLEHIAGFLRGRLTAGERRDVASLISDYHRGLLPLVAPVTLIAHFVRMHDIEYIRDQVYLNPHPKELMLRNHV